MVMAPLKIFHVGWVFAAVPGVRLTALKTWRLSGLAATNCPGEQLMFEAQGTAVVPARTTVWAAAGSTQSNATISQLENLRDSIRMKVNSVPGENLLSGLAGPVRDGLSP